MPKAAAGRKTKAKADGGKKKKGQYHSLPLPAPSRLLTVSVTTPCIKTSG